MYGPTVSRETVHREDVDGNGLRDRNGNVADVSANGNVSAKRTHGHEASETDTSTSRAAGGGRAAPDREAWRRSSSWRVLKSPRSRWAS